MKKVVTLTKEGYSFASVFVLLALVFIFSSVSAAIDNENFKENFNKQLLADKDSSFFNE